MTSGDGDPWTTSHAYWGLSVARFLIDDVRRAEHAQKQALDIIAAVDEGSGIALCLEALAWIAAARGAHERAATLQGASSAVWESSPGRLPDESTLRVTDGADAVAKPPRPGALDDGPPRRHRTPAGERCPDQHRSASRSPEPCP